MNNETEVLRIIAEEMWSREDGLNLNLYLLAKANMDLLASCATGAGASPSKGGLCSYHELLQKKIVSFFLQKHANVWENIKKEFHL